MRQSSNFLYTPRARPQTRQRRTLRVMNFGFLAALILIARLAIFSPQFYVLRSTFYVRRFTVGVRRQRRTAHVARRTSHVARRTSNASQSSFTKGHTELLEQHPRAVVPPGR